MHTNKLEMYIWHFKLDNTQRLKPNNNSTVYEQNVHCSDILLDLNYRHWPCISLSAQGIPFSIGCKS